MPEGLSPVPDSHPARPGRLPLAAAVLLATIVTAALGIGVWRAPVYDANDDQMLVAAYAQKLADPSLYGRDALLHDTRSLRFYSPAWMTLQRVTTVLCGDVFTALRVLAIGLFFVSLLSWFALAHAVSRSTPAAAIIAMGTLAYRDLPYEIWGMTGLGFAMPRSLAHACCPLLLLAALAPETSRRPGRAAALGVGAGLLASVHPPLAMSFFPGVFAVLAVRSSADRRWRVMAALLAGGLAGALPYLVTYLTAADLSAVRDPAVSAAITSYYAFLNPLAWFARPGLWKVWGFDWFGPVVLAAIGVLVGRRRTDSQDAVRALVAFAAAVTLFVAAGIGAGELARSLGMPVAEPQAVRGLRHLALPAFALAALGLHALGAGAAWRRAAVVVLGVVLLWTPPSPLRTAYYERRHGPIVNVGAVIERRTSLVRAAVWATTASSSDALFSAAGVTYDDAVLFRAVARRSIGANDKNAFAFLHADRARFLANDEQVRQVRQARERRSSADILRLARAEGADFLIVERDYLPWFVSPASPRFSDGRTDVYALQPGP
jgi:hypothetical protein